MPPIDESILQRDLEDIQKLPLEEARKGFFLCQQRLRENQHKWDTRAAKIENRGTAYRGYSADLRTLENLSDRIAFQTRLVAAYEERLESGSPASGPSPETGPDPEPEKETSSLQETPPIDNSVLRGQWIDQMYEQGKRAVAMLQAHQSPEEVRQKCPRFFTEVLDRLPEDQRQEFYDKPLRAGLYQLIGQVEVLSPSTARQYRKKFLKARK